MQRSLGDKIGEGVFSEVHAWAPGQVVKLFKPGVSPQFGRHEARMTQAVFAAGGPAPQVLDLVTVDGRFGIVLPRFDGPTLLQLTLDGAVTFEEAGAILAAAAHAIHKTPPTPDVFLLSDWMKGTLHVSGGGVPKHIATGILTLIDRLHPGDGLCHGDLHTNNVIMTAEGPRIIDWGWAVRGPAPLDLCFSHVIHTEIVPRRVDNPRRPHATNAAAQSEYARLTGITLAVLTAEMESYLPVVGVFHLIFGAYGALRERMIQRIEAALSSLTATSPEALG
jgi:tRNA A-37 threonylcarbamoyl transferase component Bud32